MSRPRRNRLLVAAIAGAVLIGAGIPMIVYGAKKVPDTGATATLAPWVAPGQAGLQLRVDL